MKKELAEIIERKHNVVVDPEAGMFTTGDANDIYGWMPITENWIKEAEEFLNAERNSRNT